MPARQHIALNVFSRELSKNHSCIYCQHHEQLSSAFRTSASTKSHQTTSHITKSKCVQPMNSLSFVSIAICMRNVPRCPYAINNFDTGWLTFKSVSGSVGSAARSCRGSVGSCGVRERVMDWFICLLKCLLFIVQRTNFLN